METARTTVVPIRQVDNSMTMDKKKLIHSTVKVLEAYLQKSIVMHLEKIEQQLYDAADAQALDTVSLDVKVLQKSSRYLPSLFIDSISKNILSFSGEIDVKEGNRFVSSESEEDWAELTLLEPDEIDNHLQLAGYISTSENKLSKLLHALRRRIEVIAKVEELKENKNPFGPAVLMNTYVELIKGESFSKDAQNILHQSFSDIVLADLGDALEDINELFISAGVLPKIPKTTIKRSSVAVKEKKLSHEPSAKTSSNMSQQGYTGQTTHSSEQEGAPSSGEVGSTAVVQSGSVQGFTMEPAMYHSLLDMAKAYRVEGGEKVSSDGLQISGEQLATSDLISTLTNIQKTDVVAGVDMQESVRSQIGMKIQVGGQRQPYGEQDDTLIDVVAMFFDVILQDRHLPDIVRAMIAQLQIPILKVAMIDKDFFAKKSHPSRQFLNALSHAGLGVSEKNTKIKSAVFEKMEELVARVLMDFDNDVEIFTELFEEFEIFMGQQQRQIDLIEERSRKATKSTEQLELTKRKAAYEIALRLNGHSIPEFVLLFLDDAWKDVLVLALLRHEREPQEVDKCMRVIERLINSVSEPANNKEKESVLADLGRLLKDIKVGLENISYDFHQSAPFFKELESWHRRMLVLDGNEQEEGSEADEVMMVDFDEELSMESLEASLLQELGDTLSAMPKDKFSKWTNNMQMGDWIEYTNAEDEVLRAKLSWKSSVTSNCLFVDARGGKALDISLVDFAEELRQKRINLLGQEKAPLVERVLLGMKNFIKGDATEASLV